MSGPLKSAGRYRPGMSRARGLPLPASRRAGADKSAGAIQLGAVRVSPCSAHWRSPALPGARGQEKHRGFFPPACLQPVRRERVAEIAWSSSQNLRGRVYGPASHFSAGG